MAEIIPFKAWRYNPELGNIKELISPLFDVVDKEQLDKLYRNPFNSIHISVPENTSVVHEIIKQWKAENVIVQDSLPSLYIYYQYYRTEDQSELKCRKGFICDIKIYEWEENIILRHENTMPHSVHDRLEILEKSEMNISPTHGLYTDNQLKLEPYMDECIQDPVYEFTDYQGVINKLGIIKDPKVIDIFKSQLSDKQVILADGHHRYTASLEYRRKLKQEKGNASDTTIPADYHCMYLSNTESNDITIYPTHRLIDEIPDFNKTEIIDKLNQFFLVEFIQSPYSILDNIKGIKHSFGILFKDEWMIATLKPGLINNISWNFPKEVKALDLTVLHFFIIEKVLGIHGKNQKKWRNVRFSFNFTKTVSDSMNGSIQMAIVTREISIEEVKKICYSGYTFPQKSTYFYPKVVCGLLFDSISHNDFL